MDVSGVVCHSISHVAILVNHQPGLIEYAYDLDVANFQDVEISLIEKLSGSMEAAPGLTPHQRRTPVPVSGDFASFGFRLPGCRLSQA